MHETTNHHTPIMATLGDALAVLTRDLNALAEDVWAVRTCDPLTWTVLLASYFMVHAFVGSLITGTIATLSPFLVQVATPLLLRLSAT